MESNTWSSQSGAQGQEGTWLDPEFYLPSDKNQGATCWKTNLMLRDEVTRVQERGRDFKRRTSFEDNLINQHIEQMLKTIRSTDLRVRQMEFPQSDRNFLSIRSSKHIQDISSNSYFTEQEKWELTTCMLENQFSPIFEENRHELIYLLAKILSFCTVDLEVTVKHNTTQDSIIQMLENNRLKLVDGILGQEIVKVVNPIFFSNVNEEPLMRIVDSWFYHILCVKQGLYGMEFQEQGETRFIEENLFME